MNVVGSELTCQVETLKLTCENYTQKLDEKERELVKNVQAVRAEEWQKQHALENEKYLLLHSDFLTIMLCCSCFPSNFDGFLG